MDTLEKLVSPQVHLDRLEGAESYRRGKRSFDPVEADAFVQAAREAFCAEHVGQRAPDRRVDVLRARYS